MIFCDAFSHPNHRTITIYLLTAIDGKKYINRTATIPGVGYSHALVPTKVVMFPGVTFK